MSIDPLKRILCGLIVFLVMCGLLNASTKPTKWRTVSDNDPVTIDHEIGDIYNAMARLPLVQGGFEAIGPSGEDINVVLPEPYSDTIYGISATLSYTGAFSHVSYRTGVINRVWLDSFQVRMYATDSCALYWVTTGKRP